MRVIQTQGTVNSEGELTVRVQLPECTAPGPQQVVLVVEEPPPAKPQSKVLELPIIHVESWPADLSLRREDLYDDWGR